MLDLGKVADSLEPDRSLITNINQSKQLKFKSQSSSEGDSEASKDDDEVEDIRMLTES